MGCYAAKGACAVKQMKKAGLLVGGLWRWKLSIMFLFLSHLNTSVKVQPSQQKQLSKVVKVQNKGFQAIMKKNRMMDSKCLQMSVLVLLIMDI